MRHFILYFTVLAVSYTATTGSFAAESTSFAIFNIKAIGVDQSYSTIIDDALTAGIHAENSFRLLDKAQMERLAKTNKIRDFDISDPSAVARTGKLLKVDKLVIGSVTKQSNYIIDIRTIDIVSGTIEVIFTKEVTDESKIMAAVSEACDRIRRHYTGQSDISGSADIDLKAVTQIPIGAYAKYLYPSYGVSIHAIKNGVYNEHMGLFISTGVNVFTPRISRYKNFMQYYSAFGVNSRFNPVRSLIIIPKIGAGPVWSRLNYDVDAIPYPDGYRYQTKTFCNLFILFETEISLHLHDRYMFTFTPGYMNIFDDENSGRLFSLAIGLKALF